ncbi:MAG: 2-oxo acid dehydrogenase subunit E2 [Chitinophagales bacterium]|jgi:2-oxoglutarate dehydrogenase E2 component (dihydrolipoamide succinyltransferase)|nr:2-oxo acid dehydrogenase subunit E2 [Chitinophagales bacterium]
MKIELKLPQMGEGIIEATLVEWKKQIGDEVKAGDILLEVATDKVNSEVVSDFEGILMQMNFKDGDIIPVGSVYALLASDPAGIVESKDPTVSEANEEPSNLPETSPIIETHVQTIEAEISEIVSSDSRTIQGIESHENKKTFLSPLVQSIIETEKISNFELSLIQGTGQDNRITKEDITNYLKNRGQHEYNIQNNKTTSTPQQTVNAVEVASESAILQPTPIEDGVEMIKMDRMRKIIADHMIKSIQVSAHVCSFVEADVTNLVNFREKAKDKFFEKYGIKLTYTPLLIEQVIKAILDFPNINVSVQDDMILKKKNINIGMAAALPDGNLIVPVIKNADHLNLVGLAKQVADLGNRAKKNQLKPDEITQGTYTVTNLGSFGNIFGTPIINQPQVAILGLGAIVKKPVVISNEQGDSIAIRSMMYLSHTYDHRVVDGFLGGSFVKRVAEYLEGFDVDRAI